MNASQRFANHDPRLISILEILGSQFVDVYFNHVYNSARTHLETGASLTDEYVRRVQAYIIGVKNDGRCYREVVQSLHKYFQATTRFTTLSFADFVERIVRQFIPEDYYGLLDAAEKDEALGSIVVDLVSTLGSYVTLPDMLRRIIDGHDHLPRVTIRMIQDQATTILLAKRGEIHNSFIRRIGQARETVSVDIVEDMRRTIRKLVKQKACLTAQIIEAEKGKEKLENELAALKQRNGKYHKLVGLLAAERAQGVQKAAFAATVPARNTHAETVCPDQSLKFGQTIPPPRAEHIAEVRNVCAATTAPREASFFAEATPLVSMPHETRGGSNSCTEPAAFSDDNSKGRRNRLRRVDNLADLMADDTTQGLGSDKMEDDDSE
ncbi:BA71V-B475L [Elysia marginata]|uniref:BA71V-B475L n=1 Tax=Elysia marginata TaxID=1093978 RepID=A0AAV4GTC8_9GAST|nr:BA71V-B475L [Elysia marginata]